MKEVERIIRVDHAGERGAIGIYSAQLLVSRLLYKDLVKALEEMLSHEREHYATFNRLLKEREIRHCYGLTVWALGGWVLGIITAILGRNAIWICTNSIETTVLHHLHWQLAFLELHDAEAYAAVLSIKQDEEEHQEMGETNGSDSIVYKPIFWLVQWSTKFAIWLSTKL
ncbi:ubiquinone biosynthesis protein Coenzyme Q7 Coq7 family protein [Alcanivorax sp. MD8A]|uniref:demethoxyubiquinone hydroxylase family protein n=1 Tax=Alcanivorax sp. MD8A TaxID=1177157 RepID=UPI000C9BFCB5|nr:demethoxyubiquinone hydroxylase family protein [Alcanivorax sp. MD8A]PNE01599.1 ubiquinone biosynthesis protein Coenzyme Q7 Coq7 family protein [Alcanivorax sp. MD8A]